jgi:hypothetical protein
MAPIIGAMVREWKMVIPEGCPAGAEAGRLPAADATAGTTGPGLHGNDADGAVDLEDGELDLVEIVGAVLAERR